MVYLTGDTHGELDRFKHGRLRWLGKRDIVVVMGDFGFVWDGSKEEQKKLDWLRKRPYTLLFLDGAHENYDLLAQYPVEERFGGRVQALGGNVYHVCRGSVLELEGKKYLCFGGTESPDKEEREAGYNWWPQEMPSEEEYAAHLSESKAFARQNPNYTLKCSTAHAFRNLQIRIHKGQWVIVSKEKAPAIHFVIRHPKLRRAIENFMPPITECE